MEVTKMSELKNEFESFCAYDHSSVWEYTRKVHRGGLSELIPAIVSCAITGGNHGKEANPNLPETLDEQVRSTYEAYKAGASLVHIHRRDPENPGAGGIIWEPELFREVNIKVREKCPDIIISNTCSCGARVIDGVRGPLIHSSIAAEPEMCSLDSTCYCSYVKLPKREGVREESIMREQIYTITGPEVELACRMMEERSISPEFELFALSDFWYLERLMRSGYRLPDNKPFFVQFVFTGGSNWPTLDFMNIVINSCPENCVLGIVATGAQQWPVIAQALITGCHVRVGMEDNVYISRGRLAESNAQLVEKAVRMAADLDRRVATCGQAREILGLGAPRVWDSYKV